MILVLIGNEFLWLTAEEGIEPTLAVLTWYYNKDGGCPKSTIDLFSLWVQLIGTIYTYANGKQNITYVFADSGAHKPYGAG